MKTCLFTVAIGDYQKLAQITHPSLKAYAKKIGAEFIISDQLIISKSTPHWEKFRIYDLLNKYDRILYMDTDMIIREDCPDLFKLVPDDKLGIFNEGAFVDRSYAMTLARDEYGISLQGWDGKYYNTGIMVISRRHKQLFKKPVKEVNHFWEQTYLNLMIHKEKVETFPLHYRYNRMTILDHLTGEERHASYVIHYAGANANPGIDLNGLVANDLRKWHLSGPDFKFKRHVIFDVRGGIGDEVDAEPAIRFAIKHVWPGEDIRIACHSPCLFTHLGIPVYKHGEIRLEPDTPYFRPITLPDADKGPLWLFLSNLMCHTVDFCAISALRRTLPDVDKTIQLKPNLSDLSETMDITGPINLNEVIIVHPGRHWPSKTFPTEYWQQIIDELQKTGHKILIIGKNDETRGTVPVEIREGVYDLRDLLSLGGLIALLSQAALLITNDSAPVHLAGAFDHHIILIPTCKHPDHIMPWRKSNKYYKAVAMFKKLTIDEVPSAPTHIEGSVADKLEGDFMDYLPEVSEVVKQAQAFMQKERSKDVTNDTPQN